VLGKILGYLPDPRVNPVNVFQDIRRRLDRRDRATTLAGPVAGVTSPGACRCHSDGVIRLKAAGLATQHVQHITRSRISQIHLIAGKLGLDTLPAGQLQVCLEIAP